MFVRSIALFLATLGLSTQMASAQAPGGPPAVGVERAKRMPITESDEFVGRVQAVSRVNLVARVTAFMEQRLFTEGSEVKKGDLLYKLERGPFEAAVQSAQGSVGQQQAQLQNATITLNRAQSLLNTPAGQRSTVDDALASQRSYAAQLLTAQANLATSEINLGYTDIVAPIDGQISRTSVTEGNVVTPTSGTLATIVSQDPMYVLFPISVRTALDLRNRYAQKGGFDAVVVKLKLPNGDDYDQDGKLDYVDPIVATSTDTVTLRASVPNPIRQGAKAGQPGARELIDGEFVTVIVQGVQPLEVLGIPRSAVLSDQQGNYVFVVGSDNKAQQQRITLGQSTPAVASVLSGLKEGDMVITEGLQRVRPGAVVQPGPASPPLGASAQQLQGGAAKSGN